MIIIFICKLKINLSYSYRKTYTVSLLVEEVYLKPSFYYKGGNIVDSSDNNNEAVTGAFI